MGKGFALPDYYLSRGRNVNYPLGKHIIGAEREASRSLPSAVDHDLGSKTNTNMESLPYFFDGSKMNLMGSQYENGLFSSSMSDLFSRNCMSSLVLSRLILLNFSICPINYDLPICFYFLQ